MCHFSSSLKFEMLSSCTKPIKKRKLVNLTEDSGGCDKVDTANKRTKKLSISLPNNVYQIQNKSFLSPTHRSNFNFVIYGENARYSTLMHAYVSCSYRVAASMYMPNVQRSEHLTSISNALKTCVGETNNENAREKTIKYIGKITKRSSSTSLNREEVSFVRNEVIKLFGESLLERICNTLYTQINKIKEELVATERRKLIYRTGAHGVYGTEDFGVRENRKYYETLILSGADMSQSAENSFELMFPGPNELGRAWENTREFHCNGSP